MLAAGEEWDDQDLIVATRTGRVVLPRSYDRALARIVDKLGLPRLTSHGLLMNTYAHVLPNSRSAVVERLAGRRSSS